MFIHLITAEFRLIQPQTLLAIANYIGLTQLGHKTFPEVGFRADNLT
jgi:hypothetical protein